MPEYVDQWPESARPLADAIRERDKAREAARQILRFLADEVGPAAFAEAEKRCPWLAESEATK